VSKISFVTEVTQEVVYTSEEPSLIMTYDRQLSIHSLWNLRQTKPRACSFYCKNNSIQSVEVKYSLVFNCTISRKSLCNSKDIRKRCLVLFISTQLNESGNFFTSLTTSLLMLLLYLLFWSPFTTVIQTQPNRRALWHMHE